MLKRILGLYALLLAVTVVADVKPAAIFTSEAVLQQNAPVRIWGDADPGESVEIEFAEQRVPARADADGKWMVTLKPIPASSTPREMVIYSHGKKQIVLGNVVVGEVWLAGGQSNMETTMQNYRKSVQPDINSASDPLLRMVTIPRLEFEGQNSNRPQWKATTPENVKGFSATAYYFAKNLREKLNVPIGIVSCSVGATPAEAWMSRATLSSNPDLKRIIDAYDREARKHGADFENYLRSAEERERSVEQWQQMRRAGVKPLPRYPAEVMGPRNYKRPGGLHETMLMRNKPQAGQVAVFQYEGRTSPAIAVHNSSTIRIENVTQYHAAGIANIFEGSENIYIDRMTMKRRGNRWYSALNDATHHVDCRGDIFITNSHFEFQNDDAVNIHGIYRTVDGTSGTNGLRLRLNHYQQLGVSTIHAGDTVALCNRETLEILAKLTVSRVEPHDHKITDYIFKEPLPNLDWPHVAAMYYQTNVNVNISGNTFQNNRARGILVKTYGKIRIHGNYFHTPGPAVITGYGTRDQWFESGPLNDLEITKNTFDQCMFGDWGRTLFSMGTREGKTTSKNIRIHNNKIIYLQKPLASVSNVENFEFYDNEIVPGKDYPLLQTSSENVVVGSGVTIGIKGISK